MDEDATETSSASYDSEREFLEMTGSPPQFSEYMAARSSSFHSTLPFDADSDSLREQHESSRDSTEREYSYEEDDDLEHSEGSSRDDRNSVPLNWREDEGDERGRIKGHEEGEIIEEDDLPALEEADDGLEVEEGEIVEEGTHEVVREFQRMGVSNRQAKGEQRESKRQEVSADDVRTLLKDFSRIQEEIGRIKSEMGEGGEFSALKEQIEKISSAISVGTPSAGTPSTSQGKGTVKKLRRRDRSGPTGDITARRGTLDGREDYYAETENLKDYYDDDLGSYVSTHSRTSDEKHSRFLREVKRREKIEEYEDESEEEYDEFMDVRRGNTRSSLADEFRGYGRTPNRRSERWNSGAFRESGRRVESSRRRGPGGLPPLGNEVDEEELRKIIEADIAKGKLGGRSSKSSSRWVVYVIIALFVVYRVIAFYGNMLNGGKEKGGMKGRKGLFGKMAGGNAAEAAEQY